MTGKPFGFRTTSQNLTNPPEGFHSVYGVGGTDSVLNFDELVLYNDHAILPLYVVRYTTTPVDICASVIYFKSPSRSSVVTCDCCSKDIEFSNAYMHCYTCGNFDLCESCYFHRPQYSKTSSHHFNSSVQASKASHSHSLTPVAPFDNLTIEKVPLKTVIQTKLVRPPPVEVQVGYYVVAGLLIPRTVQMQPEPKLCLVTTTVGFTCSKCQDEIPEEECFLNCKTCETIHCRSCARYNSHSHKMTLCVGYEA